jgi:hypothetical protein
MSINISALKTRHFFVCGVAESHHFYAVLSPFKKVDGDPAALTLAPTPTH